MSTVEPGLRAGAVRSRPLLPAPRRSDEGAVQLPAALPLRSDAPSRRERRASAPRAGFLLAVLGVALVVALGLVCSLWVSAEGWRDRAERGEAERAQLTTTAASLEQRVSALQSDLDASDARVEELAAEKARAADLREAGTLRAGSPAEPAAASPSDALTSTAACAASLRALLEVVLPDPGYDLPTARRLAVSADEDCADAQDARDQLADAVAERS